MNFNDLEIILVSSTEKPLAVMSEESQENSEKYLKDLGVKFISNDRVIDYDGDSFLEKWQIIPSNNVIWGSWCYWKYD